MLRFVSDLSRCHRNAHIIKEKELPSSRFEVSEKNEGRCVNTSTVRRTIVTYLRKGLTAYTVILARI
jgi:hypothetical protein